MLYSHHRTFSREREHLHRVSQSSQPPDQVTTIDVTGTGTTHDSLLMDGETTRSDKHRQEIDVESLARDSPQEGYDFVKSCDSAVNQDSSSSSEESADGQPEFIFCSSTDAMGRHYSSREALPSSLGTSQL